MKMNIYAIKDQQVAAFAQPFFMQTNGQAIRAFTDAINRPDENNNMYKHPDDFTLHHIGTWNDETGEFESLTPEQIAIGKNVAIRS